MECIWQYILTSVFTHYTSVGMYMAIYTHKRLYPLHKCWNVYGNIYSQASVPITHVLECIWQYILTSVCTHYTCVGMYMVTYTHKRLYPLHRCWNVYGNIYLQASVPITQVLECILQYILTSVFTHYTGVGMYMAICTYKRLYPLHMCWNVYGNIYSQASVSITHVLECIWQYILTSVNTHYTGVGMYMTIYTQKRLYPLHRCWNVYGNIYSQASVPITQMLECIWQYVLTSVCTHYTGVGMYMAIYTHKGLYPLHRCWNVYGNIYSQASVPITQVLECIWQYVVTTVCTHYTCVGMYMAIYTHDRLYPLYMCWNVYGNIYS